MKLLFKQRFFSWFSSYDIYDETGNTVYRVEGQFAWGHKLHIHDANGAHIATLRQQLLTWLNKYDLYLNDAISATVCRRFSFLHPRYEVVPLEWTVEGDFMGWDYRITDAAGQVRGTASKELLRWTDTYQIDVPDPDDALTVLAVVLYIDADKAQQS